MNRYKKELDHEKQITAIMCMVCPDHRLMRWKIEKLLRNGYPIEKIVKIVKGYCSGDNDAKYIKLLQEHINRLEDIIHRAIAQLKMDCTGCVHYDQQQTALICHECKRYYKDMYKE